jgi:3-hydroxyisobutyrate dehydrogenase-like beta-hydroxyacid dehydrogenase
MRITVFGLGEAGGAIAADLAVAGAEVHGFDPADVPTPPAVHRHDDAAAAVNGSQFVLAVTAAADATTALRQALADIAPGAVYADLATSSAGVKQRLAGVAEAAGLLFADIALMAPVPGLGLHTPALASGSGAEAFIGALAPLGMPVEFGGDNAGDAATRKLLRSVVMKGFAALIAESMEAAHAAGLAEETWANLVEQFTRADGALLRRLVEGTAPHALRRLHEMEASAELLEDLGVDPVMTRSTVESLRRVQAGARLPTLPDTHTGTPSSSQ